MTTRITEGRTDLAEARRDNPGRYKAKDKWTCRKRHGMTMTFRQLNVLRFLRDVRQADPECPFAALPGVHRRLIRALMGKGWIFISPGLGLDATKYEITAHGERALRIFERPTRRADGLCPNCGARPVHFSSSGRRTGYCLECGNNLSRRKYHHNVPRAAPDNLTCPRCLQHPRHVYPSGKMVTYCVDCTREKKRQNKQENVQRKIDLARRGELLCIRCKTQPRHCTEKSVYEYCVACLRQYMNEYNDRRRPNSRAAKSRTGGQ